MNSAADALATIRARLEALEARADARRARDAQPEEAPAVPVVKVRADDMRDIGASWKTAQGRDWLAEAREDLARVDMAPKVETRRIRPETAPEYAVAEESAAPVSKDGGHSTATGMEPERVEVGASAGNPEGSPDVEPVKVAARVVTKPQSSTRYDWRARLDRIDANVMQAFICMNAPVRGMVKGMEIRSGAGPPP